MLIVLIYNIQHYFGVHENNENISVVREMDIVTSICTVCGVHMHVYMHI